jgi:AcrR family transcriptional regulator
MSIDAQKPKGRDEVRAALISAGARLFAERGTRAVSVREIAREAGVNHGLVHRHFGSKQGLLRAVLQQLADDVAGALGPGRPDETLPELLAGALSATVNQGVHWRIMARAMLDGEDPAALQQDFPVVARMLAAARRSGGGGLSPEATVTLLVSTLLGVLLFEPYLRQSTGQDEARWRETRRELRRVAMRAMLKSGAASD